MGVVMTDQELKDLIAGIARETLRETERILKETAAAQKEIAAAQKETDRQMKETDRKWAETDKRWAESDKRWEKAEKKWDRVNELMSGVNDNIGLHAEQFFQNILEEKLKFGGVDYDEMIPNLKYKGKHDEVEFDIVLVNGDSVALIEVKHRVHPNFVKELAEERIEKFRKYFQEFKDYTAYLGIAAFSFSDEVLDQASKYGVGIIRQVGEGIEMETQNLKAY
jgi:DNA repair exonuclease SbcCD ATPase subunit